MGLKQYKYHRLFIDCKSTIFAIFTSLYNMPKMMRDKSGKYLAQRYGNIHLKEEGSIMITTKLA